MTTVVVVKKNGQVAIAADTLTKWGSTKESASYIANHQKIFPIEENYLGFSGSAQVQQILHNYCQENTKALDLHSVETIFKSWMPLHQVFKEKYFVNSSSEHATETTQCYVLIANPYGIFGVDEYRFVEEFTRFYAIGNGREYALGAIYATYNDPEKSAEEIARLAVEAAAEFDDSTGLPITSFSVQLKGEV